MADVTFGWRNTDPMLGIWRPVPGAVRPGLAPAAAPTESDVRAAVQHVIVRLRLPDPTPQIGPSPKLNRWKKAAVGYPLWLWTRGPRTVTVTERANGITFTLTARWRSTTFTMGEGGRVTCSRTTPFRPSVKPGTPSPTCGYRYRHPSSPTFTVTATTHWTISWSALGFSGSMPGSHSGSRQLPVAEIQALVVR